MELEQVGCEDKVNILQRILEIYQLEKLSLEELNYNRLNRLLKEKDKLIFKIREIDYKMSKEGISFNSNMTKKVDEIVLKIKELHKENYEKANSLRNNIILNIDNLRNGKKVLSKGYKREFLYSSGMKFDVKN